jgi:hypothetical protein
VVAIHFAGTHPNLRDRARDEFHCAVDEMIPECEKQIFPDGFAAGVAAVM